MASSTLIPSTLERFLSLTSDREQTIASNMANVDTPGYHTKDVNFKQALSMASFEGGGPELTTTVSDVRGLLERPDGNNVSMDREGMQLAKAQLQFKLGVQLLKGEFSTVMSAINAESK